MMTHDSEHPSQDFLIGQLLGIEHDGDHDNPAQAREAAIRCAFRMVENGVLEQWAFQKWVDETQARTWADGYGHCEEHEHRKERLIGLGQRIGYALSRIRGACKE